MLLDCHGYICRQTTLTHKTEGIFSLLHFKQETKQTVGNKQTNKKVSRGKGVGRRNRENREDMETCNVILSL